VSRRLPAAARQILAAAPLEPGERVIAAQPAADSAWVIATDRGLRVFGAPVAPAPADGETAESEIADDAATDDAEPLASEPLASAEPAPEPAASEPPDPEPPTPAEPSPAPPASGAWTDIEHARLDAKAGALTIEWNTGAAPSVIAVGRAQRRLASVLNERISASVVAANHVALPGGQVRVAIRRRHDGTVFSQVYAPAEVRLDHPDVEHAVAKIESQLREAAGLEI
jgi:hypothetical protein